MERGRKKKALFMAATTAVPVFFFFVLETGLRLASFGVDVSLFSEVEWNHTRYYTVNPDVVHRYFSDPDFGTYVSRDRFLAEKPRGVYRIFCLGASTTIGYPYMYNGAFSSLLRDRLEARFPDKRFEVINLGITAVTSFTVAEIAREVMDFEPDLLVVYAGHNEFYGALGVGSTEYAGSSRWLVKLYLSLQRLRTVQLVRRAFSGALKTWGKEPDPAQLMERMAGDRQIRFKSDKYEAARRYFRSNLEEIVRSAEKNGVDMVVSTLVSNLRDQAPFVSLNRADLSEQDRTEWVALFESGRKAASAGRCDEAISYFRRATELDGESADAHFRMGHCLEVVGDYEAARDAYRAARDLDALRFRATGDFNDVIRDVARSAGVPLVELEAAFDEAAHHGIPGEELFWEHLHPTIDGYFVMAEAFESVMAANGIVAPTEEWNRSPRHDDSFYREWAGLTDFDHEVARLRIELLKSRWPFRDSAVRLNYDANTLMEKAAWNYLRGLMSWMTAHSELGNAYREQGELSMAAQHFWAIAKATPYDPTYYVRAGNLMAQARLYTKAVHAFEHALRIKKFAEVEAKLGMVLYQLKDFAGTITHLEAALRTGNSLAIPSPMRAQIHTLLCTAYLNTGEREMAVDHLNHLKQLAPTSPQTLALESILGQTG